MDKTMKSSELAKQLFLRYMARVSSNQWVKNIGPNYPEKKLALSGCQMTLAERLKHAWCCESEQSGDRLTSIGELILYVFPSQKQACIDCFGLTPDEIFNMWNCH